MIDLLAGSIFSVSIFISFFIAFTVAFVKIYFQVKYKNLINDQVNHSDLSNKQESPINLNELFELIAPIFISNKDMETANSNIKNTGRTIRILIAVFYTSLTYFFIAVNIN